MNGAGMAFIEALAAVIQGDLGDGAEDIVAGRLEPDHLRQDDRRDARANDLSQIAFAGGDIEEAVGGLHQTQSEGAPLGFERVEQRVLSRGRPERPQASRPG